MATIDLQSKIPEELNELRLDQALAKLFPEYSRAQCQGWIKNNQVMLDLKIANRIRQRVHSGQSVTINAELLPQQNWSAQDIPLDVIYADEHMMVINKPAGLVVHPGAGTLDNTLVNALLHYDATLATLPRAGIIHRLDKDTTGLLVVARHLAAHFSLSQAMSERRIERHYLALVQGQVITGGTVNAPIGRHPMHRTKMAVTKKDGRHAVTHYRIRQRFPKHTLLDVKLETGRTHQIRVHLSHIGLPLVGDTVYGHRTIPSQLPDQQKAALANFKRQALHAEKLIVPHPENGEAQTFTAPLPEDFATLLQAMQTP